MPRKQFFTLKHFLSHRNLLKTCPGSQFSFFKTQKKNNLLEYHSFMIWIMG